MRSACKSKVPSTQAMRPLNWQIPAGKQIPDSVVALGQKANAKPTDVSAETMILWPSFYDGTYLLAVGHCPYCKRMHDYMVSSDPIRRPHCSTGTELFPSVYDKPEAVRVSVEFDAPMPEDIAFALTVARPDLLDLGERLWQHIGARYALRGCRKKEALAQYRLSAPWKPADTNYALQAIVRAGIFDHRIAVMENDGLPAAVARRLCLARYLRKQKGRSMHHKLRAALLAAYLAAGRGVIDA